MYNYILKIFLEETDAIVTDGRFSSATRGPCIGLYHLK
ncbi:hypothetical protein F3K46_02035 [Thermoanaerobacterium thermosaccharolyticum]|nr:hypothetical protein [Thermoanaerobacterium thermosaccharolyticum]MBE0227424.1 hypothetical protein [Thermoanaerobacterium thermosaccharolyticum]